MPRARNSRAIEMEHRITGARRSNRQPQRQREHEQRTSHHLTQPAAAPLQKTHSCGFIDCLSTRVNGELLVDLLDMRRHRVRRHLEQACYLGKTETLGHHREHLDLAWRQAGLRRRRCGAGRRRRLRGLRSAEGAQQLARDERTDRRAAVDNSPRWSGASRSTPQGNRVLPEAWQPGSYPGASCRCTGPSDRASPAPGCAAASIRHTAPDRQW